MRRTGASDPAPDAGPSATTLSKKRNCRMPRSPSVISRRSALAGPLAGLLALALLAVLSLAAPARAAELPASVTTEKFEVGKNVYVRALAHDAVRGSMWVGTSIGALEIDLHKKAPRQSFTRKDGLANEYVFAIGVDPAGWVWFGTNGGGTSRWKDGKWQTFMPMHGLADYWVYAYAFDDANRVWIGTWDGANLYDPNGGKWTTYHDELINIWVYGADIDKSGRVWLGTEGGVSMFDQGNWKSWTHEDGLGAPNLAGLTESDNTGLGTRNRHDLSIFVSGQESYNPNYVFAVTVDALDRGVWFGTWGGGLSLFDGEETWRSFTARDGLPGNIVYSMAQAPDGVLWIGTNRGIAAYDGQTFRAYDTGHKTRDVYALAIAPDGAVWAGTNGAVLRLTPGH
jgi:ligand-binding sensor domain-containing protein